MNIKNPGFRNVAIRRPGSFLDFSIPHIDPVKGRGDLHVLIVSAFFTMVACREITPCLPVVVRHIPAGFTFLMELAGDRESVRVVFRIVYDGAFHSLQGNHDVLLMRSVFRLGRVEAALRLTNFRRFLAIPRLRSPKERRTRLCRHFSVRRFRKPSTRRASGIRALRSTFFFS